MYNYSLDNNITISIFNSIRKLINKCNYSLDFVKLNENLSVSALEEINNIELNLLHINHTSRLISFMLSGENAFHAITYDEYNADQLIDGICKSFTPLSDILHISVTRGKNKLSLNSLIMNKTNFEFITYNLIYCGIAAYKRSDTKQFNITLSITETENKNVLHMRSNRRLLSPDIIEILNKKNAGIKLTSKIVNNPADLSFAVLFKAINSSNANCSYNQLKSGCRIDISFPKYYETVKGVFKSGDYYSPNVPLAVGTFADLLISRHNETGAMPRLGIF